MTKKNLYVDSVTAKSFVLEDDDGNKRCELYSTKAKGESVVIFHMADEQGDPYVSIEASASRSVVSVCNPSDMNTVRMISDTAGNSIVICDSQNRPKIRIGKDGITFFDENSNPIRTLDSEESKTK